DPGLQPDCLRAADGPEQRRVRPDQRRSFLLRALSQVPQAHGRGAVRAVPAGVGSPPDDLIRPGVSDRLRPEDLLRFGAFSAANRKSTSPEKRLLGPM